MHPGGPARTQLMDKAAFLGFVVEIVAMGSLLLRRISH
jgi:hypothetical protein